MAYAEDDVIDVGDPTGSPAFIVHPIGYTTANFISSAVNPTGGPNILETATGAPLTIDMTANNILPNNRAFGVADAIESGFNLSVDVDSCSCVDPKLTFESSPLSVEFPSNSPQGPVTQFNGSTTGVLQVGNPSAYDYLIILHEFGHYVAKQLGIDQAPGGGHGLTQNDAEIFVPPNKLLGLKLAWSEGFATFFALMTEDAAGAIADNLPGVLDGVVDRGPYFVDYSTPDGTKNGVHIGSTGEDQELAVGRALWQFYQNPVFHLTDAAILGALQQAKAVTLDQAIPALMTASKAALFDDSNDSDYSAVAHSNDFGCVLSAQAVAPFLISPPTDSLVEPNTPQSFQWSPGGAGGTFALDQFTVQFWSANWDKLIFESPVQTATSYTPSPTDWKDILAGTDQSGGLVSSLNVVVKGSSLPTSSSTGDDSTGPYKSCAIRLDIDRPAAPLVSPAPVGGSLYGQSVGLSQDGTASVVGAPGSCNGYIRAASQCAPGAVYFYSLDEDTDLWHTVTVFRADTLSLAAMHGLPDCTGGDSCAIYFGSKVAMSGNGTTAAASLSIEADPTNQEDGIEGTWYLEVVTFALVNGAWVVTGMPTAALNDTYDFALSRPPAERIALDDVGDEMLVGDPYHENADLEDGSSKINVIESDGEGLLFSSTSSEGPASFSYTQNLADSNQDPFGLKSCSFSCTSWVETFGSSVALSGNGNVATMSDQGSFIEVGSDTVENPESADVFTATGDGAGGRNWTSIPTVLTGSDIANAYNEDQDGVITCGGQPCVPEDFGSSLSLSDDGTTAFVGDDEHGDGAGAVYVFTIAKGSNPPSYGQVAELTSSDATVELGASMADSKNGDELVVGAPGSSTGGLTSSGAAELFAAGPQGWVNSNQTKVVTADDATNYAEFGTSVGITQDGSITFIGSPGDVNYTAYPGGYDGGAYTYLAAVPTTTSLAAPGLLAIIAGKAQGTIGATATLTATISPVPSGGTVAFSDSSGPLVGCGQVPVDPATGEASCPITLPSQPTVDATTGVDSPIAYSASYSGVGVFGASTSDSLNVSAVTPLNITTTSLPSIPAGVLQGPGGAAGLALAASGGSGSLAWSVDTEAADGLPDTMLVEPDGTFAGVINTPGSYTFSVVVNDLSPYPQEMETTLTLVVTPSAFGGPVLPTVLLAPLEGTTYGSAAKASVTVTAPGSNPPAGDVVTVVAMLGTATAGTCTAILPGGSTDSATCSLPASLAANTYSVAATFDGVGSGVTGADPKYGSATSPVQSLLVNAAPTTTTIAPHAPIDSGAAANVTVSITSTNGGTVLPPTTDAVDVSALLEGGGSDTTTCTATLSGVGTDAGTCDLGKELSVGTYVVTATFAGDPNFLTSTSSTDLTVLNGTAVNITVPSTATAGDSVTYSAAVSSQTGTGPPTGTISFTAGNIALCSTNDLTVGVGSCSASTAPIGGDTITADFVSPDGFASSSGTALMNVRVAPPAPPPGATASQEASSNTPATVTASVPGLTASAAGIGAITVASYSTNPTGTAVMGGTGVFYDVAVGVGSTFSGLTITECDLGTGGNGLQWWNGTVWQPFSNQVVDTGTNAGCVTATVDPATSAQGTSPTIQELTGTPIGAFDAATGDFSVNISPKSANLGENGSTAFLVTVGSTGGFSEPVALKVSGLPSGVTGSFSSTTVNPEEGTVTSVLTLTSGPTLTSTGGPFTVTGTSTASGVSHSDTSGSVTLNFELQPICEGTITGTVTDQETGAPISGAVVQPLFLFPPPPPATTAADGSYTAMDVPLGPNNGTSTATLSVSADGYDTVTSQPVVTSCGVVSNYDTALVADQFGTLQGDVVVGIADPTDPLNNPPIPTTEPIDGAEIDLEGVESGESAADGSFEIDNIALATGNLPAEQEVSVGGPSSNPSEYPLGFWPATGNPIVSAGTTTSADYALVPKCSGGSITATVYSQDTGLPLADASVSDGGTDVTTDAQGVAEFTSLTLGQNNSPITYGITARNAERTGSSLNEGVATLAGCGDSATVSLYIHVPVTNFGSFTATAVDSVTGNQITDTQITSECGDPPSVQNGVFTFSNVDVGQDL